MGDLQDPIDGGTLVPYFWPYFGGISVTVCELEHGPVEIIDFPSYKMVDFSIVM